MKTLISAPPHEKIQIFKIENFEELGISSLVQFFKKANVRFRRR